MCKRREAFSLAVLIGRGLDLSLRSPFRCFLFRVFATLITGVYDVEVPPVPIPNTEVKLNCAEDTWLATARENRSMPVQTKPQFPAI